MSGSPWHLFWAPCPRSFTDFSSPDPLEFHDKSCSFVLLIMVFHTEPYKWFLLVTHTQVQSHIDFLFIIIQKLKKNLDHTMWISKSRFPNQGLNPGQKSDRAVSSPLGYRGTPQFFFFFLTKVTFNNKENLDPTCSRYIWPPFALLSQGNGLTDPQSIFSDHKTWNQMPTVPCDLFPFLLGKFLCFSKHDILPL